MSGVFEWIGHGALVAKGGPVSSRVGSLLFPTAMLAVATLFVLNGSGGWARAAGAGGEVSGAGAVVPLVFATYAGDAEQLGHVLILTESVREFAGGKKDAPIWVFAPREIIESDNEIQAKFDALNVEVVASGAPSDALAYPFGGKVYAASAAEQRTGSSAAILAWLDEDTIVLREPAEFDLDPGETFGYRPVMHQRIGSPYDEPVDAFWTRVYEVSAVPEAAIFPVTTPADGKKIRAYFNAGVLVVRPERGLLRRWESVFSTLYHDSTIVRMCGEDVYKRVFLHQAALAAAVLSTIGKDESRQFSERVNYPLFFHEQFESGREFYSIKDAVTIRYDVYFRNPSPGWSSKIKGPAKTVAWIKARFGDG